MAAPATPKATGWVLGTVVLALLLAAGAWFLGISPVVDATSAAQEEAETTRAANDVRKIRIDRLAQQYAELDTYRAELSTLRLQIPTVPAVPDYLRELEEIGAANGVVVVAHTTELPRELVLPVAAPDPSATPEPAATDEPVAPTVADGEMPTPAPEPTGPVVPPGLAEVPFSVTVVGTFENVQKFVAALRTGTDRLFLATTLSATAQDEAEASGGRPATAAGDVEMVISGMLYVLPEVLSTVPVPDDGTEREPLPVGGDNPFAPPAGG